MLTKEEVLQAALEQSLRPRKKGSMDIHEIVLQGSYRDAIHKAMEQWAEEETRQLRQLCIEALLELRSLAPLIRQALSR